MVNLKFGIGMTEIEAEDFYRELIMILVVFPLIIFVGAYAISEVLASILKTSLGFFKYILIGIGGVGWLIILYKKYIQRIIASI